jgi:hypothetical protein
VHNDVGPRQQLLDDRPSLRSADVQRQAALAPLARRDGIRGGAHGLAHRGLDLDDIRAEVSEYLGGERAGHERREVHDPQPREEAACGTTG